MRERNYITLFSNFKHFFLKAALEIEASLLFFKEMNKEENRRREACFSFRLLCFLILEFF